jgi:hypothetical protein
MGGRIWQGSAASDEKEADAPQQQSGAGPENPAACQAQQKGRVADDQDQQQRPAAANGMSNQQTFATVITRFHSLFSSFTSFSARCPTPL